MDDIEDLAVDAASHSPSRKSTRGGSVLPKALRTHRCPERASGDNIPGVGSVYVKTWGCAHNASDGEYMAGLLAEYGYSITPGAPGRLCSWSCDFLPLNRLMPCSGWVGPGAWLAYSPAGPLPACMCVK